MERVIKSASFVNTQADHIQTKKQTQAQNTARKFEAMFLSNVVDEMMKTVKVGEFGGGEAETKWRSFLSNAIADEIAGQGKTGISQSIEAAINSYESTKNSGYNK